MMFGFTDLLLKAGIEPGRVRLLRHQTKTPIGRTPYLLWRDQRAAFEEYQSVQTVGNRAKLAGPIWASFVAPPTGGTLFAGIYTAERVGVADPAWIDPLYGTPGVGLTSDGLDRYETTLTTDLEDYAGRLWIEWGKGARSWIQRPDLQDKPIVELTRTFREDAFPGYTHFVTNVSEIQGCPAHGSPRCAQPMESISSRRPKPGSSMSGRRRETAASSVDGSAMLRMAMVGIWA
jgi:hypothetical protein